MNTIYLNFDEFGATLFIFQAHPTPRCLQEFEKKFEMRFTEFYGKIILTFRFGTLDWFYIPYTLLRYLPGRLGTSEVYSLIVC